MGLNVFAGKSQVWLESELARAQAEYSRGKTIMSAASGDVSKSNLIQVDVRSRLEHILYALYLLDPTTYPATNLRVTRTRANIYQSS